MFTWLIEAMASTGLFSLQINSFRVSVVAVAVRAITGQGHAQQNGSTYFDITVSFNFSKQLPQVSLSSVV